MDRHLILFGFKGVGKSYWGAKLASFLKLAWIDTDQLIASSPCHLYQQLGEKKFRERETSALIAALEKEPSVISLGGGTLLLKKNRQLIEKKNPHLIYLKMDFDSLLKKIDLNNPPAFIDPKNVEGSFKKAYHQRIAIFDRLRSFPINVEKMEETFFFEIVTQFLKDGI